MICFYSAKQLIREVGCARAPNTHLCSSDERSEFKKLNRLTSFNSNQFALHCEI